MRSLRLCYVGPADSVTMRRWVEWFAARGHEATIVTVEPADQLLTSSFQMLDVRTLERPRKLGRLLSALRMALALRRIKPDVVHVHYARGLAWGLPLAGLRPLVVTPWGSDVLEEQGAFREWYGKPLTRAVLKRADLVTVHSAYMEERVRPLLRAEAPIARIGWGVNLKLFRGGLDVRPLRRQWGIAEERRVIFSPRLAQPFYNHDRIIRALPSVCRKVPDALLVLSEQFADRDYVAELRRLAADLGVAERVLFIGSIPYQDMPLWMNLAEILVMVPQSDGMPNSLLEAMACGTVPVLSQLPQYAEVIRHGLNGFLVEPEPDAIAEGLVKALSAGIDRASIVERNRRFVMEAADQDREMARMEGWYAALAKAGTARTAVPVAR